MVDNTDDTQKNGQDTPENDAEELEIILDADPLLSPSTPPPKKEAPRDDAPPKPKRAEDAPGEPEPKVDEDRGPDREIGPQPVDEEHEDEDKEEEEEVSKEEQRARKYVERADIYRQEAQYGQAWRAYQDALALVPGMSEAQSGVNFIQSIRDKLKQQLQETIAKVRAHKMSVQAATHVDLTGFDPAWTEIESFKRELETLRRKLEVAATKRRTRNLVLLALAIILPLAGFFGYVYVDESATVRDFRQRAASGADLKALVNDSEQYLAEKTAFYNGLFATEVRQLAQGLETRIEQEDFDRLLALAQDRDVERRQVVAAGQMYLREHPTGANSGQARELVAQAEHDQVAEELRTLMESRPTTRGELSQVLAQLSAFAQAREEPQWKSQAEQAMQQLEENFFSDAFETALRMSQEYAREGQWVDASTPWSTFRALRPPEEWERRATEEIQTLLAQEAEAALEALEARMAEQGADRDARETMYNEFLTRYSETAAARTVEQRLTDLRSDDVRLEVEAFLAGLDAVEDYDALAREIDAYLARNPNTPMRDELLERKEAKRRRLDDTDFQQALAAAQGVEDRATREQIMRRDYLGRHPEGAHVETAQQVIAHGVARSEARLFLAIEEAYDRDDWEEREVLALTQDFLALYPSSASAAEVGVIQRRAESMVEERMFEGLQNAARAGNLNLSLSMVNAYMARYPNGAFLDQARALRADLLKRIDDQTWNAYDELYENRRQDPEAFLEEARRLLQLYPDTERRPQVEEQIEEARQDAVEYWLERAREARTSFRWETVAACAVRVMRHDPGNAEAYRMRQDAVSSGNLSPGGAWSQGILPAQ